MKNLALTLKKAALSAALFTILLATETSCGIWNQPDPVSGGEENADSSMAGQAAESADSSAAGRTTESTGTDTGEKEEKGGLIPVADFHYMAMDSALPHSNVNESFAINSQWLYLTDLVEDGEGGYYIGITRKRISDSYEEKNYAVSARKKWEGVPFLLADGEGNCYLYWHTYHEEDVCSMDKYGVDGTLLWSVDYTPKELQGVGMQLNQGTVTEDGRVYLYNYGKGGKVFAFQADGKLENVYTPELEVLEGIAAGKKDHVYGYCITGKEPVFIRLGETEKRVCPVIPLAVYDGYGDGICLRTGEGMLCYNPESGDTGKLWDWSDEYIQMDGRLTERFFRGETGYTLLYLGDSNTRKRQKAVFASVTFEDSSAWPGRETVTLALCYSGPLGRRLEDMVQIYNRQSRRYRVETVLEEDIDALERKLLRGEGEDLVDLSWVYVENLAGMGALEDLEPYYEKSGVVSSGDILDSVREACTVNNKHVAVVPFFSVSTLRARGDFVTSGDWTVWKFLEMGRENRMFSSQSPFMALNYCMGLDYGGHFIDYENGSCSFDGEEFRRILEECGKWETYTYDEGGYQSDLSQKKGDWLFDGAAVSSGWDLVQQESLIVSEDYEYEGENYAATLVGYPGWDGGEYELVCDCRVGMNNASKNKEGAWDFLEYLMSSEFQKEMALGIPSRKDCTGEYLQDLYVDPSSSSLHPAFSSVPLPEVKRPAEADLQEVVRMAGLAKCNTSAGPTNPVAAIVSEEAAMYFAGDASLDATVAKIQSRVQLYLDEL
ncbi:MAG TPA: hypothetical protein DCZ91_01100 [Lachnospiraceae bacterium]|nr:hypothetical protein [Lachnospiraceae bacterium]